MLEQRIARAEIHPSANIEDVIDVLRSMDVLGKSDTRGILNVRIEHYATRTMVEVKYNSIASDSPA